MAEKKGFNLADVLSNVSTMDTGREQMEYIAINLIDSDDANFYSLEGLEELASNIELIGLQQPVRVRAGENGRYTVVSGHRRKAALELLLKDGKDQFKTVPCIVETDTCSSAMQELRMIFANSDTRKMSSADLAKQAERVEMLFYQLKEEGVEFPGRMRDHVAQACNLSKTKLARLKVIRENLTKKLKKDWEKGKIHESAAYAFAQKPVDVQDKAIFHLSNRSYGTNPEYWNAGTIEDATGYAEKLMALKCKKCGGTCENVDPMLLRLAAGSHWSYACRQGKCCATCSELVSCKKACPHLSDKVKQLRADRKAQRDHDAEVQAERDRPTINRIKAYWVRFGEARAAADISVKSWHKAMEMYYGGADGKVDAEYMKKEAGEKINRDTTLPYGYNFYYGDADRLCKAADRLGCSIDYLLCRTDNPKGIESVPVAAPAAAPAEGCLPLEFINGMETPPRAGNYYCKFDCEGMILCQVVWWDSALSVWRFREHGEKIDAKCLKWFPLPAEE